MRAYLTPELSGGVAVRLERIVRRQPSCAVAQRNDSTALDVRQCRDGCGLCAKDEPLTTNVTLPQTARTTKQEDARDANARKAG